MPELLWAHEGVCRNFWGLMGGGYAGTFVEVGGVCPNLCGRRGGVCRKFCGLTGGMPEILGAHGGGMPELLWA